MESNLQILLLFGIAILVHTFIYKYLHVYMHMVVDAIYLSLTLLDATCMWWPQRHLRHNPEGRSFMNMFRRRRKTLFRECPGSPRLSPCKKAPKARSYYFPRQTCMLHSRMHGVGNVSIVILLFTAFSILQLRQLLAVGCHSDIAM